MTDSQSSKSRPKVIILGAGFAGLNAAKTLGPPTSMSRSSTAITITHFTRCFTKSLSPC